jgi:hypothetical protein
MSLVMAWNDSQIGAETGFKAEEVVYKQYCYALKKYEKRLKDRQEKERKEMNRVSADGTPAMPKKRPALVPPANMVRPPMSASFSTLIKVRFTMHIDILCNTVFTGIPVKSL